MGFKQALTGQKGAVLVTGLMFLALLSILGTSAYLISTTDVRISANYKYTEEAFNQAEAGVQYGIGTLENAVEAGTFSFPSATGSANAVSLPSSSHAGFSFSLSSLEKMGNNSYKFTSTGSGPQGATAEIDVLIKRGSAIDYAAFGDIKFDGKNSANVFSYDHRDAPSNQPGDPMFVSTGEGDIGSNGTVLLKNNSYIDGDVALGNDGTNDATPDYKSGTIITGDNMKYVGRVDPDPLNVGGAGFAQEFVDAQASNDNGLLGTVISNPSGPVNISCVSGTTAVYYFTLIDLFNSDVMNIDATCGSIDIYVEGNVDLKQGSTVNVTASGDNEVNFKLTGGSGPDIWKAHNGSNVNVTGEPTNFGVFTDSTNGIRFHNSSTTKAFIYAPYAEIELNNSGDVYGAFWGASVLMHNSGDLFYDEALKDKYFGKDIQMTAWNQVLN